MGYPFFTPMFQKYQKIELSSIEGLFLNWGSVQWRPPHPKNHWTHYAMLDRELTVKMRQCMGVSVYERYLENF